MLSCIFKLLYAETRASGTCQEPQNLSGCRNKENNSMSILYNQRDATYTMFSTHYQEPVKLYMQPCVLSWFPAVYRWCGWVGPQPHWR
jgi:hypothetical protein